MRKTTLAPSVPASRSLFFFLAPLFRQASMFLLAQLHNVIHRQVGF